MGLNEYEIDIDGITHTVQLSDEDAKTRGLDKPATKAATPKNKQRKPEDK